MQNAKCKMQSDGHYSFRILHSAFCILHFSSLYDPLRMTWGSARYAQHDNRKMKFATIRHPPSRLLIFARVPERGLVKTRLASQLGEERTLALYQAMLQDLVQSIGPSDLQIAVEVVWTATAQASGPSIRHLFPGLELSMQCGSSLGERLLVALDERFVFHQAEKLIAIGSDDPTIDRPLIETAFALLDCCDWVVGPAVDGGYYLIGCRAGSFSIRVFEGIDWGQSSVLERTLETLKDLHETVALLPVRTDLDGVDDVREFSRAGKTSAARTLQILRDWGWAG
jgi:rSAM/selenodomain-associated transferase 1